MAKSDFIKWLIVAVGAAVMLAARAHADPIDSRVVMYGAQSSTAVCSTLAEFPSFTGVAGVMQGIEENGHFTVYQAAQVVVIAVEAACPERIPLLQAFADTAGTDKAVSAV